MSNVKLENASELGKSRIAKRLTPYFRTNKANGYALIILVMLIFAAMVTLTKPIILTNVRQFRDTNIEYAKDVSETFGIASASHIRKHINEHIYPRMQAKLIEHAKRYNSDADTYECDGTLYATKKANGKLSAAFSMCDIDGIFDDLLGDTNQTVDLLSGVYPDHKIPLSDKKLDGLRKSIIEQFQNNFDYTIRTIFVNQETLNDTVGNRVDRYRFQVRADVETHTYFDVTDQMIIYFDVLLDTVTHNGQFGGAGNACNQEVVQPPVPGDTGYPDGVGLTAPDIPYVGPDGKGYIISGDGGGVFLLYVKDRDGIEHQYGSDEYNKVCGTLPNGVGDPYCRQKSNGMECKSEYGGDLNCKFSDGTSYYGYQQPRSIRVIGGCASARTGQSGQRGVDFGGYSFTLVTRLSGIGSTFN